MKPNLTPRAIVALSTAAVCLFLLLCFFVSGAEAVADARGPQGVAQHVAAWLVAPLGVGAHLIAALGLVWGVVVFFQERTPDLVLRGVGTLSLAASAAMVAGLLHSGQSSAWAGTVGTSAAKMMVGMGTFGAVLGWVVALALFAVSAVFATDWFFHTLRRGPRPQFDPASIATEPPRAELLGDAEESADRVVVRAESRAAAVADVLPAAAPKPLEVEPSALPQGFSAIATEERTVVRGPSGYGGVEFLPPSDELAGPERSRYAEPERMFVGRIDTSGHGIAWEEPAELAGDDEPATESVEVRPQSGIGVADASLLVDEVFAVPSHFSDSIAPHDGASAAEEIAADLAERNPPTGEVTVAESAQSARIESEASARIASEASARIDDEMTYDGPSFDDVIYVYDESRGLSALPPTVPEAIHVVVESSPAVAAATPESAAVAVAETAVAVAAPQESEDAPAFGDVELFDTQIADVDLSVDVFEPFADVAVEPTVEETPVAPVAPVVEETAAVVVEAAVEETAVATAVVETASATAVVEATVETAIETAVVEATVEATVAAVVESATDDAPAAEPSLFEVPAAEETSAIETAAVEPEPVVAEVTPAVAETITPVVEAATPTVEAATPTVEAAKPSQLALFATPACDLRRLHAMELDPLFFDAATAILGRGRASAVVLQRALGIGYARGLRILDQMTEAGMLGPDAPGGAREICFTQAQWDEFLPSS